MQETHKQEDTKIKIQPQQHKKRDCYLGGPETHALGHALLIVEKAFGEQCYLVGSVTEHINFRDVDVRMILNDDKWEDLFGSGEHGLTSAFWSLLTVSISEYLQKRTGLPIDFQIQRRTSVSKQDWDKRRIPTSMYVDNLHPTWRQEIEDLTCDEDSVSNLEKVIELGRECMVSITGEEDHRKEVTTFDEAMSCIRQSIDFGKQAIEDLNELNMVTHKKNLTCVNVTTSDKRIECIDPGIYESTYKCIVCQETFEQNTDGPTVRHTCKT